MNDPFEVNPVVIPHDPYNIQLIESGYDFQNHEFTESDHEFSRNDSIKLDTIKLNIQSSVINMEFFLFPVLTICAQYHQ